MDSGFRKGIILSIISCLTGVLSNTSIKFINSDFNPVSQTLIRTGIALVCIFILFRDKISLDGIKTITTKQLIILLLIGVIGSASAFYFITLANIKTSLAHVAIVKSPQPLFIFLLAIPILKEKFSLKMLVYLLLSVYGVLIVSTKSFFPTLSGFGEGEFFALLSTFCFGLGFVGRKMLAGTKMTSIDISFWTLVASTATLIMLGFIDGNIGKIGVMNLNILLSLLFGGLMIALTVYLNNESLRYITATLAGQLRLFEVVFSVIIGFILFSEFLDVYSIIGGVLIIGTVYFSTLFSKNH